MAQRNTPGTPRPSLIGQKRGAKEYGLGYTSLRGIVQRGEIPAIRVGRAVYLDRRDIEEWIESRKERA